MPPNSVTSLAIALCSLLLGSATVAQAQQAQEQELAQLKQQIQLTERQVQQQRKQLEQAEQKLQQSDRALAEAATATRQTEQERAVLSSREQELLQQRATLEQNLAEQQDLLASQLKSAYSLGQHDYSKLLLNQQDAGKLERVLSYYQYFNQARLKQLNALNQTITQLQLVLAELADKQQQLATTLQLLQQQQQQLAQAKSKQQQAVTSLQDTLKKQGRQLDYLRQNESSLQTTLEQLRKLAEKARELTGLGKQKGKLSW
ncbi:MAG: metallopeptidase, partial [Rheinheimera sp.]|nr:metallopeptidase [Rheinheimera sp.]